MPSLFSFDIFDTLLTRCTAEPEGIFALIEYRLQHNLKWNNLPDTIRQNFYLIRKNAELLARKSLNQEIQEYSLDTIYQIIQKSFFVSHQDIQELKKLEIQTEKELLLPIQKNINLLKRLKRQNKRVVLISDMYLPRNIIQDILISIDPIFKEIPIYVSVDYNRQKRKGTFYNTIQKIEKPQQWYHIGDDLLADIQMAKQNHINAHQVINEPLTYYEKELLSQKPDDAFLQLGIGVSRYCRILNRNLTHQKQQDTAVSLFAPVIVSALKKDFSKHIHLGDDPNQAFEDILLSLAQNGKNGELNFKPTSDTQPADNGSFGTFQRQINDEIRSWQFQKYFTKTYASACLSYQKLLEHYLIKLQMPDKFGYYDSYLSYIDKISSSIKITNWIRGYIKTKGATIAPFFNGYQTGFIRQHQNNLTRLYQQDYQQRPDRTA